MNIDIEERLRAELLVDAQRSPEPPEQWQQPTTGDDRRSSGTRRMLLGAACAAAVVAGGVLVISLQSDPVERMASAPSVAPTVVNEDPEPTSPAVSSSPVSSSPVDSAPVEETIPAQIVSLAVGGVVMFDAAERLVDAGFVVDALPGRTLEDLVAELEQRSAAGEIGSSIVLDPTVLDPVLFDDAVLADLADVVDGVDRVVLVTSYNSSTVAEANNIKLRSLADSRDNFSPLDWPVVVEDCWCTYRDGVHLRDEGRSLYAHLVAYQTGSRFDPAIIRTNLGDIRTRLPQMVAPPETDIDATEVLGPAGEGRTMKVFGAPDSVCVAETDLDGSGGSGCSPNATEGLLWLWSASNESNSTETLVTLHHSDVSVRIAGCDVRTVVPDGLDLAVSSCTPGNVEFLDVDFVTPDATYRVTTPNLAAGPGLPELETADLFDATVDDWIIADNVPTGYQIEVIAEDASHRQTKWVQTETGDQITLTQLLFPPGSAPNEPGGVFYDGGQDATSVTISGVDTHIEAYAPGLDPEQIAEFVNQLRIGRRDEVPGHIVPVGNPSIIGDLVFIDSRRGQVASVTAQARDGGWCINNAPGAGICPEQLPVGLPITAHGGGYGVFNEGDRTVIAGASGLASNEVAMIEVLFIDGTIAEVTPTDLTGDTGIKFWNISVALEPDTPPNNEERTAFVDTITAYDNTGRPLARDIGNGPARVER